MSKITTFNNCVFHFEGGGGGPPLINTPLSQVFGGGVKEAAVVWECKNFCQAAACSLMELSLIFYF